MTRGRRIIAAAAFLSIAGGARGALRAQGSSTQGRSVQVLGASVSPDSLLLSDVRIVEVASGGSWEQGDRRGHYRVIVLRDSAQMAHHTTYLQWLERQGLTERVDLVYSVDMHSLAPQYFQILAPQIKMLKNNTWVLYVDVATRPMVPTSRRLTFALGPPGVIYLR